jgi:hypothetical protein
MVLHRRRARPRGGIPVPGSASGISDATRRACRTLVRARRREVRLSRPVQRLNRMSPRRLNRLRGRNRACARHPSPLLATCGSFTQRSHATRRILASLARGLCTTRSRFGCLLSAARDAFPPIPSGSSFGYSLQCDLQPVVRPPQSVTTYRASTRHITSGRRQTAPRSERAHPPGHIAAIPRLHQSRCPAGIERVPPRQKHDGAMLDRGKVARLPLSRTTSHPRGRQVARPDFSSKLAVSRRGSAQPSQLGCSPISRQTGEPNLSGAPGSR